MEHATADAARGSRFLIEVRPRAGEPDSDGAAVLAAARELGVRGLSGVTSARLYELAGAIDRDSARRAAREVFCDPLIEESRLVESEATSTGDTLAVTVSRRPGVMDPACASARKALHDVGIVAPGAAIDVRTARRFWLRGRLSVEERAQIERRVLGNAVIEEVVEGEGPLPPPRGARPARIARREVPLLAEGVPALARMNKQLGLALSPLEMDAIAAHFAALGRDPTDVELETVAQTWSEHCKHKTLTGPVRYRGPIPWDAGAGPVGEVRYRSLLKETIFASTKKLDRGEFCLSVFVDNAGVVAFDDDLAVCMKVETHNHPSALEPYGGAGTGVGGVVRDILGTGLGAQPIASIDVFCFAPPDLAPERVPPGTLHPRRIARGVVAGVRDYGNQMGIPTVAGGIVFDERYAANPVVYCGTVGVIPRLAVDKAPLAGDAIVVLGGRTGRDGIHGATFSSLELDAESERTSSGAVQIGNAIEEKRVLDVLLQARRRGLFRAVTDCGAGGLSSAVGEMAQELGARVDLALVKLKYEGLEPAEIWISEAQERMVLAVPQESLAALLALSAGEDVEATSIGEFTSDGRLRLWHGAVEVGDIDLAFLHDGLPKVEREASFDISRTVEPSPATALSAARTAGDDLLAILSHWDVCSREAVIRQYDHEVQGRSALKAMVGEKCDGPGDAAVLTPVRGGRRGIAIACGIAPRRGDLDPYRMAQAAVDEALRNVVAVGADPGRTAILDNFAWGDCSLPDRLGAMVLACEGAARSAEALGTPFISGKDSLNNELRLPDGTRRAIPHTLLVSALAIVEDVSRVVSMDWKRAGNALYLVGRTRAELGGGYLRLVRGAAPGLASEVPSVDLALARKTFFALHRAISDGLILSCHDLSEGGLAIAAAEMALAGRIGGRIDLGAMAASEPASDAARAGIDALLFAESTSRFLLEVAPEAEARLVTALAGVPLTRVGETTAASDGLKILAPSGAVAIDLSLARLVEAFKRPLETLFPPPKA